MLGGVMGGREGSGKREREKTPARGEWRGNQVRGKGITNPDLKKRKDGRERGRSPLLGSRKPASFVVSPPSLRDRKCGNARLRTGKALWEQWNLRGRTKTAKVLGGGACSRGASTEFRTMGSHDEIRRDARNVQEGKRC